MRQPKLYEVGECLYSIKEAAEILGFKEDTIRKKLRRGAKMRDIFAEKDHGVVEKITASCEKFTPNW